MTPTDLTPHADSMADVVPALVASAMGYAAEASAPNTRRAYRSDWRTFERWCAEHGASALEASPATVAMYLAALADAGRKASTIARAAASISHAHKLAGAQSPCHAAPVREVLRGIRRRIGTAPAEKAPVMVATLRAMVGTLNSDTRGVRDRALLTLGFAGAFRRSELVSLEVRDLQFTSDGLVVTLRRSKTDQEGAGRRVGVPYGGHTATCPVRSLRAWLEAAAIESGPVFRRIGRGAHVAADGLSDRAVARIVQRTASAAGFDGAQFGGHSLRAGLATSAASAGKHERAIMAQTGHRSVSTLRRYIRHGQLFTENAAAGIGL